ncbi:MAG: phosphoribosylaminoimidazolesuccinocarboxamide synthase [Acidobacteriales bacterium]|nr:phosphoribosylaminoimidazolesuccinocarboxamide synthase [Terriglobales bacterium]
MNPTTLDNVLLQTDFPDLELYASGKVRDVYRVDNERLLFVATDRISAFDYVLATGIPQKGRVLTQLSLFWFEFLKDIVPNHLITADVDSYPANTKPYAADLRGRSMLVMRADMFPVECVVRGYLSGSGWKEYSASGKVCGIQLPPGLKESDQLPEPIFTPATKATTGHDINISFEEMCKVVDPEQSRQLRDISLALYSKAAAYARERGIIIADTKFEFGMTPAGITLGDEVLTPDSSRFWPADKYAPGKTQDSYDKQYVRDYLEEIHWNKQPPAPALPPEVARNSSAKYVEAYQRLTGRDLNA